MSGLITLPDAFIIALSSGIFGGVFGGLTVVVYLRYVHPKPARSLKIIGDANRPVP